MSTNKPKPVFGLASHRGNLSGMTPLQAYEQAQRQRAQAANPRGVPNMTEWRNMTRQEQSDFVNARNEAAAERDRSHKRTAFLSAARGDGVPSVIGARGLSDSIQEALESVNGWTGKGDGPTTAPVKEKAKPMTWEQSFAHELRKWAGLTE